MRLNKLSHKSINSWLLLAALFAPIVYLFGALFTTQLGAHGEIVLHEPVYVDEYVEVNSFVYDGSTYKLVVDAFVLEDSSLHSMTTLYTDDFDYTINGEDMVSFKYGYWGSGGWYIMQLKTESSNHFDLYHYINASDVWINPSYPLPWTFESADFNERFLSLFPDSHLYKLVPVPTDTDSGSLSDYLFKDFFAKDNFLAESGRNVIEGTANYGFQPMGELIRFTDANMLHLSNLEYGYLMIGYAYYAIHVIFLDLIVYLTLFIPRLIRGLVDRLEGGVDL